MRRVAQRANRVTFNLVRKLLEHVDLSEVGVALLHALEHVDHPASSFTAGRALAATLVLVELGEAQNCVDHIRLLVHHDDGCCAETRPALLQIVEVHDSLTALPRVEHLNRRAARDDGLQVVPAANDATGVALDQLSERDAHLFFNSDRVVDVATDAEEFGARILVATKAAEPVGSAAHDRRAHGDRLHVRDRGRAAVQASVGWEGRLQSGATGLALERLDEGRFLTADVRASATVDDNVEVVAAAAGVLADETLGVGLVHGSLQLDLLIPELATNVDVCGLRAHTETDNKGALDELVRVVTQDLAVLASAGLRLVGVDNQVRWSAVGNLGHEGVLQTRGETSAAATAQARLFDFIDDPIGAHRENVFRLMPVTALEGTIDPGTAILVQVGEDAVLVRQVAIHARGNTLHHRRSAQHLASQ
eukprot:CAMPEP_0170466100 /NCGR_PEP_ID=MMETSP0123-20130129/10192_1 /TAXON_ID=182087 /ORGANISM="Favella ehrenbergii, Strain Fehren 1" /LENGTH=420 /DNA_ID=CAMNT_0010732155 /DNA_START=1151 /DNA_END=2414 /DNA_ORIENTATION=-